MTVSTATITVRKVVINFVGEAFEIELPSSPRVVDFGSCPVHLD